MRGRPLVEWLIFVTIWVALLVPLREVTRGRISPPLPGQVEAPPADDERGESWIRLVFSERPDRFRIRAGDIELWREDEPDTDMESMVTHAPSIGLDLAVHWSSPGRRAVEMTVTPVEGRAFSRTFWTESERLEETVGLP